MPDQLEIDNLTVSFGAEGAPPVLDGVSLGVAKGEVLAIVGESGSGKSMTAMSVMKLLPRGARMKAGGIRFDGVDILGADERTMNRIRGDRVSMLFQQPKRMLDPTATVGRQVAEPLRRYAGLSRHKAADRVIELLSDVGIAEPERRAKAYAHQLSGGIAQRVMIAMALAGEPELLIADEPTTALDVTVEVQVLRLIATKRAELGMSVLFISHDLGVVSSLADRIAVMYAGRIVEVGTTDQILRQPQHPYTRSLIKCATLARELDGSLFVIPGDVSSARSITKGCRFMPRCPVVEEAHLHDSCDAEEPPLSGCANGQVSRCWATIETRRSA
ncbi:ABC transporter ATP-binding protein [Occultella glacieicola]|uniref:ABC transporter ATP-binding protein n=1 Tax=Occultella glacieicola TaxID=2518684 RepID=A0ABY2DX51_9MICO|nr:ABC transporter ATP-binding protein [Occultella glacieicola]TDE88553.1 ABC transporter ATP-binding protein [Occultella glacieicola]